MKSLLKTLSLLLAIICLTGCHNVSSNITSNENSVTGIQIITETNTTDIDTVIRNTVIKQSSTSIASSEPNGKSINTDCEYDIDLTQMNSNMVFVQISDMINNGDNYLGKTVKVKGPFSYFQETDGREFFAVIISDATACCSQGIEFVLDGDYSYPEDYPEIDTEIVVTGEFNYYKEGIITYCQLLHANMKVDAS